MPRFHLHVYNGSEALDEKGVEFADLDAAKLSAVLGAREMMSDDLRAHGYIDLSYSIKIADAEGLLLHVTRFAECIDIRY